MRLTPKISEDAIANYGYGYDIDLLPQYERNWVTTHHIHRQHMMVSNLSNGAYLDHSTTKDNEIKDI